MSVVSKLHVCRFEQTFALYENSFVRVDENVRDSRVCEQRFKRSQPKNLVEYFLHQTLTLLQVHRSRFAMNYTLENQTHFAANVFAAHVGKLVEIELLNQLSVNGCLDGTKVSARCSCDNWRHGSPHFFVGNENRPDKGPFFSSIDV